MSLWFKKEKVCATCIHWSSKRNVDFMFVDTKNHEGKCVCEEGFYKMTTIEGSTCSDWKGFNEREV